MKKVTIIGSGDSGLGFESLSFEGEVWGVNNLPLKHPNAPWTRIFEVHAFTLNDNIWLRKGEQFFRDMSVNDYIDALNATGLPIYILNHRLCPFKNSVVLNLEGKYRRFFSTTISYQLALAIDEGFTHIDLLGIDMSLSKEYRDQRPSATYFIGLAEGRGIIVSTPKNSPLVTNDYSYGKNFGSFTLWDRRIQMMRNHIAVETRKHEDLLEQYKGSLKCLETMVEFYTTLITKEPSL